MQRWLAWRVGAGTIYTGAVGLAVMTLWVLGLLMVNM
jgi:hypothetical protein